MQGTKLCHVPDMAREIHRYNDVYFTRPHENLQNIVCMCVCRTGTKQPLAHVFQNTDNKAITIPPYIATFAFWL